MTSGGWCARGLARRLLEKGLECLAAHACCVDHLTGLERKLLEHGRGPVRGDVLDPDSAGLGHHSRLLGAVKVTTSKPVQRQGQGRGEGDHSAKLVWPSMWATWVLESLVQGPILWGKALAYSLTDLAERRSEFPSLQTATPRSQWV